MEKTTKKARRNLYITDGSWGIAKREALKCEPKTTRPRWIEAAIAEKSSGVGRIAISQENTAKLHSAMSRAGLVTEDAAVAYLLTIYEKAMAALAKERQN
jgi:hypothetical protein